VLAATSSGRLRPPPAITETQSGLMERRPP
jgi:hypothetical protein